ncbi:MAG TPA: cyclase family protein [Gemmatimonadaceae bacterium]|nr:cyclase family protein [Gemmatimonadaceae bacterium]
MLRDISLALRPGTPEWPGDTPFSCRWTWAMSQGASVNVSAIATSPHVGTHADAPLHVQEGWPGAHELPLDAFVGPALLVDASELRGEVDLAALTALDARVAGGVERLLLRTGRTIASGTFPTEWPSLTEGAVRALAGGGLRLLGVDAPSVDQRESKNLAVHRMLFSSNAYILENLDLRRVPPGEYELMAFPQKLMGLDAAPVRAVLRDQGPGPRA